MKAMFKEVSDQVYSVTVVGAAHVPAGLTVAESDGSPLSTGSALMSSWTASIRLTGRLPSNGLVWTAWWSAWR